MSRNHCALQSSDPTRVNDKTEIKYTLSIGVATLLGEDDSLDAMMQRADEALYKAKQSGRNQVVAS